METEDNNKQFPLLEKLSAGEKLSAFFSLVGICGIALVFWQINLAVQAIESSAQNYLTTGVQELNKAFLDKPHLWPYFEEGKVASTDDKHKNEVLALTDMHIDFIDELWTQSDNIKGLNTDTDEWNSWNKWISDLTLNAPSICSRLSHTKGWYSESFIKYMENHCKKESS